VFKFDNCSVNSVRVRVNRMYGRNTKLYGSDESEGSGPDTWRGVFCEVLTSELCVYKGLCVCVCKQGV